MAATNYQPHGTGRRRPPPLLGLFAAAARARFFRILLLTRKNPAMPAKYSWWGDFSGMDGCRGGRRNRPSLHARHIHTRIEGDRSMIKKIVGAALILLLVDGLGFGFGGSRWTYDTTRTLFGMGKDSVKANMPIGFEIERAKRQLEDMRPVIAQHKHRMLEEEAQLAILDRQIKTQEKKLAEDREEIMILKNDLTSGKDSFRYGGRVFTVSDVKQDLTRRFERLKTNDATVEKLRQTREARQRRLEALQDKVVAMEAAVRQMDAEVENLEAQLQLVEAAEAGSSYNLDDSPLSRLKQLMADLQTRVEVRAKMADREVDAYHEIPVRATDSENIVDEVTRYLEQHQGHLVLSN